MVNEKDTNTEQGLIAFPPPSPTSLMNSADTKALRINLENFTRNLNRHPNSKSIFKYEGYDYIPVSFIEKDLDRLYFGLVQYELLHTQQIFNEMVVTARIKVFHPVLLQWMNYDGIGASVIMQDANSKLMDFNNTKKKNALKLAAPIAYAEAIKNAAKKIGRRFGADLNRKDKVGDYDPMYKENDEPGNNTLN